MKKEFSLALCCILLGSCSKISIQSYEIHAGKNSGVIRCVQISDFHSNDFGKAETKLIEKILSTKPDLIVLTGDIFDFEMKNDKPTENVRLLLAGISGLCPFYYVTGNHEFYRYHRAEFSNIIEEFGGTVLNDAATLFTCDKGGVVIAGVNDPFMNMNFAEKKKRHDDIETYKRRLRKSADAAVNIRGNSEIPVILLAHRPELADEYENLGFDIVLSGHAHGGQWRLPKSKRGLYAPDEGLFPKHSGGLIELNDGTALIVSRGLSYQKPKFPRFFNPPELVVIEIAPISN